jgi:hypothetical protein
VEERQSGDDADDGHAHEPPNGFVVTRAAAHVPHKFGLLLGERLNIAVDETAETNTPDEIDRNKFLHIN